MSISENLKSLTNGLERLDNLNEDLEKIIYGTSGQAINLTQNVTQLDADIQSIKETINLLGSNVQQTTPLSKYSDNITEVY